MFQSAFRYRLLSNRSEAFASLICLFRIRSGYFTWCAFVYAEVLGESIDFGYKAVSF